MSDRTLLVTRTSGKIFRLTIPEGARVTFGPWSPPTTETKAYGGDKALSGTLRVYSPGTKTTENILGVWSGVEGFRDEGIGYAEMVEQVVGSVVWNDSKDGYVREEKVNRTRDWDENPLPAIGGGKVVDESEF